MTPRQPTPRDQIQGEPERWRLRLRQPEAWLRPFVTAFAEYEEQIDGTLVRRELPTTQHTLIINLDGPLRVQSDGGDPLAVGVGGFLAGIYAAPAETVASGRQRGLEVRLTPLGARRLLGMPLHLLANCSLDLETLLGAESRRLVDQLQHLADPAARLSLVEDVFTCRIANGPAPSPELTWAWRQLDRLGGGPGIADLAAELGWSHKRLIRRFREEIGVSPKTAAQILRFERAVALLPGGAASAEGAADAGRVAAGPESVDWADLALRGGYCDQSHLVREFQRFAGRPPGQVLRERLATSLGAAPAAPDPE